MYTLMTAPSIVYLLMGFGTLFILADLMRIYRGCPPPKVVYRYLPKTFEQEQDSAPLPSTVFKKMFEQPDSWTSGIISTDSRPRTYNQYWISQE